jgi:DNA-binding MarR family transcriptional regulator
MMRTGLVFLVSILMLSAIPLGMMGPAAADRVGIANPAEWTFVQVQDFDYDTVTVTITQNGNPYTVSWDKGDWDKIGSMGEGTKGGGPTKEIYAIRAVHDEYVYLKRYDGDNDMLMSMEGVPAKTMYCYFLVSEIDGTNVTVKIDGKVNGAPDSRTLELKSTPMEEPSVKLTMRPGSWGLKNVEDDMWGTWQDEYIHVYGIGFTGRITLDISNDKGSVKKVDLTPANYMAHFKWDVPKDTPVGVYTATITGTGFDGNDTTVSVEFYVAEENIPIGIDGPIINLPRVLVPFNVVLVSLLCVVLFTRLKRSKLFNNAARMRIYQHIKAHPGVHYRAILKDLKLKMGTLTHHVNILEREGHIRSYQDGVYRRFYRPEDGMPLKVRLTNIQERILNIIKDNPGISQANISKKAGSNKFVVNYHVKILSEVGMVFVQKEGRTSQCFVTG